LPFDEQVLLRILEVLYEAPTNPSQWRTFLQMTGEALGGESGSLLIHDFGEVQSLIVEQWNVDPEVIRKYEAHYTEKAVWFQRIRNSRDWLATRSGPRKPKLARRALWLTFPVVCLR